MAFTGERAGVPKDNPSSTRRCSRPVRVVTAILVFTFLPLIAPAQNSAGLDENRVLAHLNAVVSWYKELSAQAAPDQEPSDTVYSANAENLARHVLQLAFKSARAEAVLISPSGAPAGPQTKENFSESAQRYAQVENEVSHRIADDEAAIKALKSKPAGKARKSAEQQEQSLEGKLALDKAALDAVQQMEKFLEDSNAGGSGLERSINELARSVPEVFGPASTAKPATATTKPSNQPASGLFGQLVALYRQMLSIRAIEQRLQEGENIQKLANARRAPLRQKLTDTVQQGKNLSTQEGVSKQQYDALTQQFKQLSAALLPLSEEILVLDQSRSNLLNWRRTHTTESRNLLLSILLRVAIILTAIGIIVGIAEAWRRLTFRYVRDPRRRRQFLVLRRFVMGFFICTVLVLGFVSEFSSLATFAGFVTAGVAVGLQTVLLSVAAYFFVIGRYGIRVGDRITIAGVTGDVVDLGLVRFYLMEFTASGPDLFPTGRIVVFSNSVLFQPTTPLYKQLPGTHYTWHEAVLPLAQGADRATLEKSLSDAVHSVYQEYSRQAGWQNAFNYDQEFVVKPPEPEHRLQFSDSGAELVVRYPVDLHRGPEIDGKIIQALIEKLGDNGNLPSGLAGMPKIRTTVKV
jgi:small-conductance mechanosensitive channel